jgi:methylated-DNA-[protein]-cysteine S-methyltransferase
VSVLEIPPVATGDRFVAAPPGPFVVAAVEAPWGPIHVAACAGAAIGLAVLAPRDAFAADVRRHTGREEAGGVRAAPDAARTMLDEAVAAVEAFLGGDGDRLGRLPLDLGDRGPWDRAILGAVAEVPFGRVTSYGRIAGAAGRPGAARAAGGAVGRNPIGLAIPCHRVIAGDGSIGGYGGDWFGTRDELLAIKRELLAIEGVRLPTRDLFR